MFNISIRKVGGIRFLTIGRFNLTLSVSSRAAYLARLEARCEQEAMRALVAAL